MTDKLEDLARAITHEIASLKAERQALQTQVHSLQMTKAELQDEVKSWPGIVAEYRALKAQAKTFADDIEEIQRRHGWL